MKDPFFHLSNDLKEFILQLYQELFFTENVIAELKCCLSERNCNFVDEYVVYENSFSNIISLRRSFGSYKARCIILFPEHVNQRNRQLCWNDIEFYLTCVRDNS